MLVKDFTAPLTIVKDEITYSIFHDWLHFIEQDSDWLNFIEQDTDWLQSKF